MDKISVLTMVPEGTVTGLLLRQLEDGRWKVSLRTAGPAHAGLVLREAIGGGGHRDAAGAVAAGDPAALESAVLLALDRALHTEDSPANGRSDS